MSAPGLHGWLADRWRGSRTSRIAFALTSLSNLVGNVPCSFPTKEVCTRPRMVHHSRATWRSCVTQNQVCTKPGMLHSGCDRVVGTHRHSILGHLTPGQYHEAVEQTAHQQVDNRNNHSAMIPTGKSAEPRSSNRAPQVTVSTPHEDEMELRTRVSAPLCACSMISSNCSTLMWIRWPKSSVMTSFRSAGAL